MIQSFIHSFFHWFVRSFAYSLVRSFILLFILSCSFIDDNSLAEPKNKNAKKNLLYYKMELQQLETKGIRDPGYLNSKKPAKKKEDYMEIYEKLCQGKETRV